jgi:oligopeptide transport system substrate-binding protein
MSWLQDFRVALNLWEGLTTWDPQTLQPIAGAAHLPPIISSDGLTYTFQLRDDARWSNGDPVTAHDFVRGWRRAMEPGTAADYRFFFSDHISGAAEYVAWREEGVAALLAVDSSQKNEIFDAHAAQVDEKFARVGLQAEGDRTLVIQLTKPCPYFQDLLGFPTFLPIHQSMEMLREKHRGAPLTHQGLVVYRPQWTHPRSNIDGYPGLVTNGPYALTDWTFKRAARLSVNPFFRDADTIPCRTVDMLEYDNVSASLMAFDAGDVDFLTDLSVPYEHELHRLAREGERKDLKPCKTPATYFFNFNCASLEVAGRRNPFIDPRVRRAFTLATDRVSIVENVRKRGDRSARTFVPPDAIPGYQPPAGLPLDVAAALELLTQAGFASGAELGPIELLYPPRQANVCQALARMWEDSLGVQVELRAQESKTFAEEKARQRFMIAWGNWYPDYNDPTTFLDCFASGNGNNDSGYSNPKYDELLAAATNETDPARRMTILQNAERLVMEEDCPVLPVLHPTELIAVGPRVTGIHPNSRMWFPFRYVSVTR